jgi:hypothetical protein
LFLGFKFLTGANGQRADQAGRRLGKNRGAARAKIHPHSAFMTGFVRVMGNLGVLLTWMVLAANLMAHDWVADTLCRQSRVRRRRRAGHERLVLLLSFGVSRGHGKFSEKTLLRLQHLSGICLIAVRPF